jgi:glycosyltransferase involved in cell wall biosynthesis
MRLRALGMKSKTASYQAAREILVVGPFPPPVHGFAQATMDVAALLQAQGFRVKRIDLKPIRDKNSALSSLGIRISQFANLLCAVWRGSRVYVGLSGGMRQVIDLVFLAIGRLGGARLYVHHHSFAYLNRPTRLASICIRISGRSATHIVLCSGMKTALQRLYKSARNVEVISNAGLKSVRLEFRRRTTVQQIGYLGALTAEKGILEFLSTAAELSQQHRELRFSIAGPCDDVTIREQMTTACRSYPSIHYVGSVYGDSKYAFLGSLDVLLFPSSYSNEAEPLVILEAMSSGIPVIGWDRGCIGEMLLCGGSESHAIQQDASFGALAAAKIETWLSSPERFCQVSVEVRAHFERLSTQSQHAFERIFPGESLKIAETAELAPRSEL